MKLHFSFTTEGYEQTIGNFLGLIEHIEEYGVSHRWNSCSYYETEILVSHNCFIPGHDFKGKVFYDIVFEEDPKNVFVEVKNDSDPEMLSGISTEGIEIFTQFNNLDFDKIRYSKYKRPTVIDIFTNPEDPENQLYGFCVDKIKFDQILEINVMYNNDYNLEVIKTIYKKEI